MVCILHAINMKLCSSSLQVLQNSVEFIVCTLYLYNTRSFDLRIIEIIKKISLSKITQLQTSYSGNY